MSNVFGRSVLLAAVLAGSWSLPGAEPAMPAFREVYELIRTNAGGLDENTLNRAAVNGLLGRLSSTAWLADTGKAEVTEAAAGAISSSAIFDDHFGYIRVVRVGARLPENFSAALDKLMSTNRLKGLVVDLRFAEGADYAAAVKVADRFIGSEQALLDWGQGTGKSSDKTNAFKLPVAILINQLTAGSAEALAAMLRQADVGLLIGTNTAGQASITRDFPLSTGGALRVAVSPVKLADGSVVGRLKPDILVEVSPDDEKSYFVDAYKLLPRSGGGGPTNAGIASLSITNRPRRRLNEAELVRMLRDGENPEEDSARSARAAEPVRPTIADPALARAVDLLKALAVVRHTRF